MYVSAWYNRYALRKTNYKKLNCFCVIEISHFDEVTTSRLKMYALISLCIIHEAKAHMVT
jgi:hypothetical protein